MTAVSFRGGVDCGFGGELEVHAQARQGTGQYTLTSGVAVLSLDAGSARLLTAALRSVVNAGPGQRDHVVIDLPAASWSPASLHVYRVLDHVWIGQGGMAWRLATDEALALAAELDDASAWVDRQREAAA